MFYLHFILYTLYFILAIPPLNLFLRVCACACVCVCVCVCVRVCVFACLFICLVIYLFIYTRMFAPFLYLWFSSPPYFCLIYFPPPPPPPPPASLVDRLLHLNTCYNTSSLPSLLPSLASVSTSLYYSPSSSIGNIFNITL